MVQIRKLLRRLIPKPKQMSKQEAGELILKFVGDLPGIGEWEWDDFLCCSLPEDLQIVRSKLCDIEELYPSKNGRAWCSDEGVNEMRKIAHELLAEQSSTSRGDDPSSASERSN